ncbi:MAG: hypothetical protein NC184_01845 [Roseburia sp.]|nr:hypothetical protein [Roseburia sp.]
MAKNEAQTQSNEPTECGRRVRDGGTDRHEFSSASAAYRSVSKEDKRRAFIMLGAAAVTLAVLLLSRLLWLFEPLLDKIYYGTLSEIVYYIALGVLFTIYIVFLNRFIVKHCDAHIFGIKKDPIILPRALGVIAVSAVAVFIAGAVFGFQLKMQSEMGLGVTLATALTNISVYFYYAFHMWLGFTIAVLLQHAMSTLFPSKYTVPWGAVALVTVFGLVELIFELYTTSHLYPWLYYLYTFVYGAIFTLTERRFHISYWASVIVMVL